MSQQKMSHSLNRFRTKMRKQFKGHDGKNSPDSASTKPSGGGGGMSSSTSMTNTCSTNSPTGFLGAPKRAVSVSSPPDSSSSPVHQVSLWGSVASVSLIHTLLVFAKSG